MNFRLELSIKKFPVQIHLSESVMLMGSCFTDHISKKLAAYKFKTLENPHGILFNPKSIEAALHAYASGIKYEEKDLFFHNELWASWSHHGQFAHPEAAMALQLMNASVEGGTTFLKGTKWLIITLGSSWVYELKDGNPGGISGQVAANCHKVSQQHFRHRILTAAEVRQSLQRIVSIAKEVNPAIRIIFTISPVRHHREGLVENNRSKALLISAVHDLINETDVFYFPSYELIIDDLRDYRFYAEDLVHPNYQATQYVWEKFLCACISETSIKEMDDIGKIIQAKNHRSLHPSSPQHQKFLANMLEKTKEMQQRLPYLDFSNEITYFSAT